MNDLQVISGVECYEKDGVAYLKLETVARGLGFTQTQNKNGSEYTSVRWERIEDYLSELGFPHKWGKDDFIPENVFYRLAMKAKNEAAEKFQAKIADEVIPSIRKTGGYSARPMSQIELIAASAQALLAIEQEQKALAARMDENDAKTTAIKEAFVIGAEDWRDDCRSTIYKIAELRGGGPLAIKEVYQEAYSNMDARAGLSLETRKANMLKRMAKNGATKSAMNALSMLDVIAQDKKTTEIFISIVREMAARYL